VVEPSVVEPSVVEPSVVEEGARARLETSAQTVA
jgi:hypothetical protein